MTLINSEKYPCPLCGSSDAVRKDTEGGGYCFSCEKQIKSVDGKPATLSKPNMKKEGEWKAALQAFRGIDPEVFAFFGVETKYVINKEFMHRYPYGDAWKVRNIPEKAFVWEGKYDHKLLFGQDRFPSGGKRVVIVEGEMDVLSVAQASMGKWNKVYPVVGLPTATERKALINAREWLRTFDEVILCLDNDEAGKNAQAEAIKIIGLDKVKVASLGKHKDPNEMLQKEGWGTLLKAIWEAGPYIPPGILNGELLWEEIVRYNNTESVPYPPCIGGLNDKLKGMRFGELSLFVSGTSSGKSTMTREIMLHLLKTTPYSIGVASLEETPAETARKLIGMEVKVNPAARELSDEELRKGFDTLFKNERVILLDHQGRLTDGSIMDKLEYMCLMGCRFLFIDHITILTSEVSDGYASENSLQDKVMNDLARLTKRYPVWIGLVSHLRKKPVGSKSFEEGEMPSLDDIKGSGSIKQVSFDVVGFARNLQAEDPDERNLMRISVLKCRYTGLTGQTTGAYYDYNSGRLKSTAFRGEK